jgi:hypothetical protein
MQKCLVGQIVRVRMHCCAISSRLPPGAVLEQCESLHHPACSAVTAHSAVHVSRWDAANCHPVSDKPWIVFSMQIVCIPLFSTCMLKRLPGLLLLLLPPPTQLRFCCSSSPALPCQSNHLSCHCRCKRIDWHHCFSCAAEARCSIKPTFHCLPHQHVSAR